MGYANGVCSGNCKEAIAGEKEKQDWKIDKYRKKDVGK